MSDAASLVLVVENDDGLRSEYGSWLVEEGYRILGAANGLEALELTRMHRPPLLLMNLDLPGLDGWEATRVLRRDPRLRDIKVVALTSWAVKTRDCDGRSAGCDAALRTPLRRQTLIATVRRFVAGGIRDSLVRVKVDDSAQAATTRSWLSLGRKRA